MYAGFDRRGRRREILQGMEMKKMRSVLPVISLAAGVVVSFEARGDLLLHTPIDVIGNLSASQFTSLGYGTNTYKDWGNEPSAAVNPLNPSQIVVSSFSFGTSSTSIGANIFYSTTGGTSWTSQFSVPAPGAGITTPRDWNFAYDSTGLLHAAVLGGAGSTVNVYHGSTTDPTSLAAWNWTGGGTRINTSTAGNADQPWLAVQGGRVFVGYDDFTAGVTLRVTASNNNGTTFAIDNAITNGARVGNTVNPGTRITTDGAGNVYSIFGLGPSAGVGTHTVTYFLNRSRDGGATWDFMGSSAPGGIVITSGTSRQLDNAGTQASNTWFARVNDLRGNITAIAADATGAHVYTLIGKQDAAGTDRIYLREFHPSGANLVGSAEIVISPAGQRAAFPSITVLANRTVVIMYDAYDSSTNTVHVHIATSSDFGASIDSDVIAYSFVPLSLLAATGSSTSNREFGDYQYLMSLGDTFYGVFAGLGNVNGGGINTTALIDPFFVSGTIVPEPPTLLLMLGALLGFGFFRHRTH